MEFIAQPTHPKWLIPYRFTAILLMLRAAMVFSLLERAGLPWSLLKIISSKMELPTELRWTALLTVLICKPTIFLTTKARLLKPTDSWLPAQDQQSQTPTLRAILSRAIPHRPLQRQALEPLRG